jgi:outer membrane lipoprotein SlyB
MIRFVFAMAVLALVAFLPLRDASAQNNTVGGALLGGAAGAVIGGAATGKAGGAVAGGVIGAAAGAMLGSQLERRHGSYYWHNGRCYQRRGNGNYYRVSSRHC